MKSMSKKPGLLKHLLKRAGSVKVRLANTEVEPSRANGTAPVTASGE
jgi:hypothetical protein